MIKKLSAFDQTVLEICAQAKDGNEAVTYVQDWLNDKDTKCTRSDAMRYITNAKLAERKLGNTAP